LQHVRIRTKESFETIQTDSRCGTVDSLGFRSVQELKGQDPVKMYFQHCIQKGMKVDRCMLYVFRCAVYYASNSTHNPELLKWWNWKDINA